MNGSQQIAAALGGGLIAANFWTSQRHIFTTGALNSSASSSDTAAAHTVIRNVAVEILFVGLGVLVAGVNGKAGGAVVAALLALWIVWLITHYAQPKKGGH